MTQLLQNAVYGTALILAAAILRRALGGRLIPEARLTLWGLCLIRLLAPVFPDSGLSLWGLLPQMGTASTAAPVIDPLPVPSGAGANLPSLTAPAPETVGPGLMPAEPAGAAFPWEAVLLSAWIGVGLLLAARYALSWNRTRRAVAQAIPLGRDDPRYAPLPKCARLREGVMDGAPLTFGAARPTVVLSPGLSGGALDCVLAHEAVHARRRDNLWHYAMAAALVLYWWNPAVWLMARLLRRDIELSCDRAAVKKLGAERRAEYAETLVKLATAGADPAFCQTFGRKAAEERILSVMKFKKTTVLGVILSLALVAGVTVAFASGPKAPAGQNGGPGNNTPYQVCADPLCGVDYQHCHIDGEVVRAYDEYPGLLCAHPDCEIEGPHEHDGVQYAGKAGKYVILNQGAGPVESVPPQQDGADTLAGSPGAGAEEEVLPEFVPDYDPSTQDSAGAGDEPAIGALGSSFYDYTIVGTDENGYPVDEEGNRLIFDDSGKLFMKVRSGYAPCVRMDCDISQEHHHEGAEVVYHYNTLPAELPVCPVEGCTETRYHAHNEGRTILLSAPCPVEGCAITGSHIHGEVCYSCNGAGHSGGVCDWSCYHYAGNGGGDSSAAVPSAAPVSGGHHGNGHHSGHH